MKRKISKRLTTMITVLLLMLLIIPAGALLADSIKGGAAPGQSLPSLLEDQSGSESETRESEEETKSSQAETVAERIARASELGIPPGRLNLIDKLAAELGQDREALLPIWQNASAQDIMKEIQRHRFAEKGKDVPPGLETEVTEASAGSEESTGSANKGHANGKNK